MNTILSMLVPAMVASFASAIALGLSAGAPARWRLGIAAAGLLSWVMPWPLLILPFTSQQASIAVSWIGSVADGITSAGLNAVTSTSGELPAKLSTSTSMWTVFMAIALLPGLLMFLADIVRYRRTLAQWNRDSVDGEQLRIRLPQAVRHVPHAIRVVPRSGIAAATGLLRGTIWVGDGLTGHAHLNAALLHECLHIARKDALTILTVTFIKRLYFWNPVVRYFAHRAEFFIEAACDESCAQLMGRSEYRNSLATLILDSQGARNMAFVPMMKTGRQDVARVAALGVAPRLHARACIGAALCALGLGAAASLNAQGAADPRIGAWDETRTSTDYQSLLRVFEHLDNGMTRMYVNAKLLEPNRWHVDFKCDGKKYRTLTHDDRFTGITYSCRQTGTRTIESSFTYGAADAGVDMRWTEKDRTSGTWTETVSADGKRYTTTGVSKLKNGQTRESRRDFVRRESKPAAV